MSKIRTCLWYDGNGAKAARFYVSLIPNSAITSPLPDDEEPLMIEFHLAGVPYLALNGGPLYQATPAASIMVFTQDQAETDDLWNALTADGGQESHCGWCIDRFGISWQVVPDVLPALVGGPDPQGAARATQAMMAMAKIEIAALQAAYDGVAT